MAVMLRDSCRLPSPRALRSACVHEGEPEEAAGAYDRVGGAAARLCGCERALNGRVEEEEQDKTWTKRCVCCWAAGFDS